MVPGKARSRRIFDIFFVTPDLFLEQSRVRKFRISESPSRKFRDRKTHHRKVISKGSSTRSNDPTRRSKDGTKTDSRLRRRTSDDPNPNYTKDDDSNSFFQIVKKREKIYF